VVVGAGGGGDGGGEGDGEVKGESWIELEED
jgi:hypothetical protein